MLHFRFLRLSRDYIKEAKAQPCFACRAIIYACTRHQRHSRTFQRIFLLSMEANRLQGGVDAQASRCPGEDVMQNEVTAVLKQKWRARGAVKANDEDLVR